jgi:abortive infection bacteriophage resistance protein
MNLIQTQFPNLSAADQATISKFIVHKCSEFYFIDFLQTTSGNVLDAIELFKLDERLRAVLIKYLLRFEIQIKNDFVQTLEKTTNSDSFWNDKQFYLPNFCVPRFQNGKSDFDYLLSKISESLSNLNMSSTGASDYAAFYAMSFGTFIRVFKQIKPVYKFPFSQHYTRYLPRHDFDTIHTYLLCIRALRNRCAHGNHLVSINLVNQLNQYSLIKDSARVTNPALDCSEFELTLLFLFHNLICFRELIRDLHVVLLAYEPVYSRYGGKQSINPTICAKLFR